jgi:uncharacterized peroxidase-related enzyme
MSYLPSLPSAALPDVLLAHPEPARPLMEFTEVALRGPSPLSVAERELVAAFVSGLNACGFCHGSHTAVVEALGVPPEVVSAAVSDLESAPVSEPVRVLLRYAALLTRTPAAVTAEDAAAVVSARGERALHDLVLVCAMFNMMNRYVDGLGIHADLDYLRAAGRALATHGYAALLPAS